LPINDDIEKLISEAHSGMIIRDGLRTVIAGKPNVGKSSLMNALLRGPRAIVAELPGTTRDLIEETADIRGIALSLADTAGLHATDDPVEAMGIGKSREALGSCGLVLLVFDLSSPIDDDDIEAVRSLGGRPAIALLNKADLPQRLDEAALRGLLPGVAAVRASMKTGEGLEALEDAIENLVCQGRAAPGESPAVTNARHADLLERAAAELGESLSAAERREAPDLVEIGLRQAWALLGEITGEGAGGDLIDEIFSRFCVGK
jgi:tRNA modification GTPase